MREIWKILLKKEAVMMEKIKKENLNEALEKLGRSLGASALGFSNLKLVSEEKRMGYSNGVTLIVRLSDGILNQIKDEPTQTYFSHYRTVNRLIDEITLRLVLFLEEQGYPSVGIPASQSVSDPEDSYTGAFQHKTGGVLSGLGWIGKSALFIHKEFGPRVRMGTILTNAPLKTGEPIKESQCGECKVCVTTCPSMAIEGKLWKFEMERKELYDPRCCSEYMKEAFHHIGRGVVCGLCVVACPIGKNRGEKHA